jgi:hypothetical protein
MNDRTPFQQLCDAVYINDFDEVTALIIQQRLKPEGIDVVSSFLYSAVIAHRPDVVMELLGHVSINPDLKDNNGTTALQIAALQGDLKIVQALLRAGADPNLANNDGITPLTLAAENNHRAVVTELLKHGADDFKGPNFSYNKQVIIDFTGNEAAADALKSLAEKWDAHHPDSPCKIIPVEDFLKEDTNILVESLFKSGDVIRIYIIAHGGTGLDFISKKRSGDERLDVDFETLAEKLARFIGDIGDRKAVINLVSGNAGKGSQDDPQIDDSFAAKLHQSLAKFFPEGSSPDVVARTTMVSVENRTAKTLLKNYSITGQERKELKTMLGKGGYLRGQKTTLDLDIPSEKNKELRLKHLKHWQEGSKFRFMQKGDKQIKVSEYPSKWKAKVIKVINESINNTTKKSQKKFLKEQLRLFSTMKPEQIFNAIYMLSDHATLIREIHFSDSLLRLFIATTYDKMGPLIAEGEEIFDSKHAVKHPVPTGRSLTNKKK